MRYINVTIIDSRGDATSTQIMGDSLKPALDWFEEKMMSHARANNPLVAAFIYDTRERVLLQYSVNGISARIVTAHDRAAWPGGL